MLGYHHMGGVQDNEGRYGEFRFVCVGDVMNTTDGDECLPPRFLRGECNDDGAIDIADAVCILNWRFSGTETPGCVAATNVNGDEVVDLSDAVWLLNYLFVGGFPPPVAPYPDCGSGWLVADSELGCLTAPKVCQP